MSPTVTIFVTTGSDSANHGSFSTIGVSQLIAFSPTWWATTVAPNGLDSDASWKTVSGSILLAGSAPLRTSLTPKPFAYTALPPCTTTTAMPGRPDFFIRSSTRPSSLSTAFSTAFSGNGIAGTNGGGTPGDAEATGLPDGARSSWSGGASHAVNNSAAAATTRTGRIRINGFTPAR